MEKHEYRGYEINIEIGQLRDGRTVTDSRITPISEEEKGRMGDTKWIGSKELHSRAERDPAGNVLEASRRVIDILIDGDN